MAVKLIVNGKEMTFEDVSNIKELLEKLVPEGQKVAVAKNGTVIPKDKHSETTLSDGDKIEIVRMVGGG